MEKETIVPADGYEFLEVYFVGTEFFQINHDPIIAFKITNQGFIHPIPLGGEDTYLKARPESAVLNLKTGTVHSEDYGGGTLEEYKIYVAAEFKRFISFEKGKSLDKD